MLNDLDKVIIRKLQNNLPLVPKPYEYIAKQLNISEEYLLSRLRYFKDTGLLRRVGAIVHHRKSGYAANAMVVWDIPEEELDQAGKLLSGYAQVTHCYHRKPDSSSWPYKLFAMMHSTTEEECKSLVSEMAQKLHTQEYQVLFSTEELKKTSMQFFAEPFE